MQPITQCPRDDHVSYTPTHNLRAFLIWNALVHLSVGKVRSAASRMRFYWIATRERYEQMLASYTNRYTDTVSMPSMIPDDLSPLTNLKNEVGHSIGRLFGLLILILAGASLLGPIANATTGITIAHTGFTPNPNVTQTPGYVALIQVIPLIFVGVVIGFGLDELQSVL